MGVVLCQILVEVFGVVSHGHRQKGCLRMIGLRMRRSGEIGCVSGLMVVYVYRRDELCVVGLGFGETIDECLGLGNHGGLG